MAKRPKFAKKSTNTNPPNVARFDDIARKWLTELGINSENSKKEFRKRSNQSNRIDFLRVLVQAARTTNLTREQFVKESRKFVAVSNQAGRSIYDTVLNIQRHNNEYLKRIPLERRMNEDKIPTMVMRKRVGEYLYRFNMYLYCQNKKDIKKIPKRKGIIMFGLDRSYHKIDANAGFWSEQLMTKGQALLQFAMHLGYLMEDGTDLSMQMTGLSDVNFSVCDVRAIELDAVVRG